MEGWLEEKDLYAVRLEDGLSKQLRPEYCLANVLAL